MGNKIEDVVRVTKAAKAIGVSRQAVHEWIKQGKISYITADNVILIPVTEITRIKNQREKNP